MKRLLLVLSLSLCAAAGAQDHQHHHPAPAPPAAARTYVMPDIEVQTQNGDSVRFHRDLVQGRVVAINFIFTSCTTVCPIMGATFARVQKLLAGRDVALVSVSIDPAKDTPQRLAEWSQRLGARPGWTLVTGSRTDIDRLLKALGLFTADPAAHSPVVLVGDDARGRWERVDGLATPAAIIAAIDRITGEAK